MYMGQLKNKLDFVNCFGQKLEQRLQWIYILTFPDLAEISFNVMAWFCSALKRLTFHFFRTSLISIRWYEHVERGHDDCFWKCNFMLGSIWHLQGRVPLTESRESICISIIPHILCVGFLFFLHTASSFLLPLLHAAPIYIVSPSPPPSGTDFARAEFLLFYNGSRVVVRQLLGAIASRSSLPVTLLQIKPRISMLF